MICGCKSKNLYSGEVNVLNWSSYIPDDVLRDFERKYHIKVNYGTYSSNEELLAKVSSSKEGTYDVVFPSDYSGSEYSSLVDFIKIDIKSYQKM